MVESGGGAAAKISPPLLDVGLGSEAFGFPLPGCSFRVVDPDTGDRLPAGRSGELQIKGPGVTTGYYGDADATSRGRHRRRLAAHRRPRPHGPVRHRAVRGPGQGRHQGRRLLRVRPRGRAGHRGAPRRARGRRRRHRRRPPGRGARRRSCACASGADARRRRAQGASPPSASPTTRCRAGGWPSTSCPAPAPTRSRSASSSSCSTTEYYSSGRCRTRVGDVAGLDDRGRGRRVLAVEVDDERAVVDAARRTAAGPAGERVLVAVAGPQHRASRSSSSGQPSTWAS